jgi:hypothetical protein
MEATMFNSLEENIEEAEGSVPSNARQLARYAGGIVLAALILGALYLAIRLM